MNMNWKKVALIGGPLLVLGGLILWSNKATAAAGGGGGLFGGSSGNSGGSSGSGSGSSGSGGGSSAPASNFPLQLGSNNNSVKVLQGWLHVSQDGIFGADTLAALQSRYCMTSVPDQAALDQIAAYNGVAASCQPPATDPFEPVYNPTTGVTTYPALGF